MTPCMVGRFLEFGDGEDMPSVMDAVGVLDDESRNLVAAYLDAGTSISAVPGFEHDVFDGSVVPLTRSHQTDGVYIWRHELAYYVRRYGIGLSADFVQHVRDEKSPPGVLTDERLALLVTWLKAQHRSSAS